MPYVKKETRPLIVDQDGDVVIICPDQIKTAGDLNYALTRLFINIWNRNPRYQTWNDISGATTECIAEFRRRVISGHKISYEEIKIGENGDCFEDARYSDIRKIGKKTGKKYTIKKTRRQGVQTR